MANEELIVCYLATPDTAYNTPQPDPNASLGPGRKSSTEVADYFGTMTSVVDKRNFVDSSATSTDFTGGWLVLYGANPNEAHEIKAHDTGTGAFELKTVPTNLPVASDRFRVYMPNGLFAAYTADQASRRPDRHRLLFWEHSIPATTLILCRTYVVPIQPGPLSCEAVIGLFPTSLPTPRIGDANAQGGLGEEEIPSLTGNHTDGFCQGYRPQSFGYFPTSYAMALQTPRPSGNLSNIVNADSKPAWARLVFPDGSRHTQITNQDGDPASRTPIPRPQRCVFQVFVGDGTTAGSYLIVVDLVATNEERILGPDRVPRLLGGSRVQAQIRDADTLEPIPDYTVTITLDGASPGTLGPQNSPYTLDDGTILEAIYFSGDDPADVGDDIDFQIDVVG